MRSKRQVLIDRHARSTIVKTGAGPLPQGRLRALFVAGMILFVCIPLKAQQLPDAPSVIAPLKRYSLNLGLDSKYSLTNSALEFTPRIGIAVRLGARETVGVSYSHPIPANVSTPQNNSVIVFTSFRVMSWGKIPKGH